MNSNVVKVKKIVGDAILPQYAHPGDAGMDLFSSQQVEIKPGSHVLVKTGVSIELPPFTEAQVRPRSGLALKHGITVLNTPGTVDEGYRGEIGVILINHGKDTYVVEKGAKIAQMVISSVMRAEVVEVSDLSDTQRGAGGFGSTGYSRAPGKP